MGKNRLLQARVPVQSLSGEDEQTDLLDGGQNLH
jgi:hypothetical protein